MDAGTTFTAAALCLHVSGLQPLRCGLAGVILTSRILTSRILNIDAMPGRTIAGAGDSGHHPTGLQDPHLEHATDVNQPPPLGVQPIAENPVPRVKRAGEGVIQRVAAFGDGIRSGYFRWNSCRHLQQQDKKR